MEHTDATYRIHRSVARETIVFALSGEVNTEHADRLEALLASETDKPIVLDLQDVTLVHGSAVLFLSRVEDAGVRIVNCPEYVRRWITAERSLRHLDAKD